MSAISCIDLCKYYQQGDDVIKGLDHVSLEIEQGSFICLSGPSGSGKTTLLNTIGGLDALDSGEISIDGERVDLLGKAALADLRLYKIGFVFQAFHLVPRLSAAENVELPLLLGGVPARERRARVDRVLELLQLADRAHHKPDQLSGGQRQRVAIARATVTEPSVLLADEPTGNLDQHSGLAVIDALEALNARRITLIVVTHDAAIGRRAGRQIKMVDGRITADRSKHHASA